MHKKTETRGLSILVIMLRHFSHLRGRVLFFTNDAGDIIFEANMLLRRIRRKLLGNRGAKHLEHVCELAVWHGSDNMGHRFSDLGKIQALELFGNTHKELVQLIQVVQQMLKSQGIKCG